MKKQPIRKSLRASFIDGTFFSVMMGFGDNYFLPYAIALKAGTMQVGLLSSLPGLVSSLFQLKAPEWTEKNGRMKILTRGIFMQAAFWLLIILAPYLFPSHAGTSLIFAVTLYLLCSGIATPAWTSIMSQYLPRQCRGKYFSWRGRIHGAVGLAAMFAAGMILHAFPRQSVHGFTLIFSIAMACRFISWYYTTKMYEPKVVSRPGADFTFRQFLARGRDSNFLRFVFFVAAMNFSVYLASPFFSVHLLRDLQFSYLTFTLITIAPSIATFFSLRAWGRDADRAGNLRIIKLTSYFIPLLPFLWMVSSNRFYLGSVQALSGFAWAGFNLAAGNFILDAVSEEKRVRCVAYYNVINGTGIFLGAALGGWLISRLPSIAGSPLLTIFLISGIMRLIVRQVFLTGVREVRPAEEVPESDILMRASGLDRLERLAERYGLDLHL